MTILNSPDISVLSIHVTYDISGVTPNILLRNDSQGANLAGVSYAWVIKSPTTTLIHDGDINNPDKVGVWTEQLVSDPWPRPFNQIEWSGAPYTFQVTAKDSEGNVFTAPVQATYICPPTGNIPGKSKNTYGLGALVVNVKCEQARIFFQDVTNTSYQGETGDLGSSVLRVNFPMDNTGVVPDPFQINYFSTAMVPVTYSGKGYQFLYTSIYQYEFDSNTAVRIKYVLNDTFGVWCNIDLMPLVCEYQKLINSIENGTCSDVAEANNKLMLINPKFSMVVMGMFQPLTGIDVPALIEEIQVIGGFDCDCCNAATGIVPNNTSAIDGYNFSIVPTGGDITGSVVANGYNIQFLLGDISYVFKICDGSPAQTTAFEVIPSLAGSTKTYCLTVDMEQLAEDLYTVTGSSAALVNLFNSLIANNGGNTVNVVVDGKCIFDSNPSCDYTFTMHNIPASSTYSVFTRFDLGSNTGVNYNFSFNQASLASLQTFLNTLNLGSFVVSNLGGGDVQVTSSTNSNNLLGLLYNVGVTSYVADMSKVCAGYTPITINQFAQNIVDYLCASTDANLKTSAQYEICYINPVNGAKIITTVDAGTEFNSFISQLLAAGCNTIDYIKSLGATNCTAIKEQFPTRVTAMGVNDGFLGTKGGLCSNITPLESFLTMLVYGQYNQDILDAFCTMVYLCAGGNPCQPYTYFYVTVETASP